MRRWVAWMVAVLVILVPVASFAAEIRPGRTFLSGDGNLFYQHGGTMAGPLTVFVVIFSALVSDDDGDSQDVNTSGEGCWWWDSNDSEGFPLEAFQLGSSAGVFVGGDFALGVRGIVQGNDSQDPVASLWGLGPELSWYPGPQWSPLRPFVGVSALYVRGHIARAFSRSPALGVPASQRPVSTAMYQVRTGLSWFGPQVGIYVQATRQFAQTDHLFELPTTRSKWGAGLGITFYLQ